MNNLKGEEACFDFLWEVKYHFNFDMFLSIYLSMIIFNSVVLVFGGIPSSSASLPLVVGFPWLSCRPLTETRCLVAVCLLQCAPRTPCTTVWP